jgi:hypothetical protein
VRKRILLLSSVALIGALGATSAASAGTGPARPASPDTSLKSPYWAGYVATSPVNARNDYFKYVTATFTVPAIASCAGAGYTDVSQYAGLSGYYEPGGNPLQAAGLYESCNPGTPQDNPVYYAAYWNAAGNGTSQDQPGQGNGPTEVFTVSPGDVIMASVYFNGPPPSKSCGGAACQEYDTWQVTDQTTGQTWKMKLACDTGDISEGVSSCDTNTAEVITQGEVLNNDGPGAPGTPDFGQVSFSAVKVTDYRQGSAHALTNSAWTTTRVVEYGTETFQPDVTPGPLTSTTNPLESAFTNTWHRLD